jgi:integrase/recombinase XerD
VGLFTYTTPTDNYEISHNNQAKLELINKRSSLFIKLNGYPINLVGKITAQELNFIHFYDQYVINNSREGNRHLRNSLNAFVKFIGKQTITPPEITEEICERFRNYLFDNYNGETPSNYFFRFRKVMKVATRQGLFALDPAFGIKARSKQGIRKEILTLNEIKRLVRTECTHPEIKKAAIVSLYSGLRWIDVYNLKWENIKADTIYFQQKKTGVYVELPLHNVIRQIIGVRSEGKVLKLSDQGYANRILRSWVKSALINKHITWHCLRHSFSVLLQDLGTDTATVAGMLGHTSTKYVERTYQRYKLDSAIVAINKLPTFQKKQ